MITKFSLTLTVDDNSCSEFCKRSPDRCRIINNFMGNSINTFVLSKRIIISIACWLFISITISIISTQFLLRYTVNFFDGSRIVKWTINSWRGLISVDTAADLIVSEVCFIRQIWTCHSLPFSFPLPTLVLFWISAVVLPTIFWFSFMMISVKKIFSMNILHLQNNKIFVKTCILILAFLSLQLNDGPHFSC